VAKRRELEAAIDEAIRTSAFTLVYQPIVVPGSATDLWLQPRCVTMSRACARTPANPRSDETMVPPAISG
jgi:hypothetical protein